MPFWMLAAIFWDLLLLVYTVAYYAVVLRPADGRGGGEVSTRWRRAIRPDEAARALQDRMQQICIRMERWVPRSGEEQIAVKQRLMQAGFRRATAPAVFYGLIALLTLGLPALLGLYWVGRGGPIRNAWPIALIAALSGYLLPRFWLRAKIRARQEALRWALPDALDLLVVGAEAGSGIDHCLHRVSRELARPYPELAEEFQLVLTELRAGQRRKEAFRHLTERTGLDEIGSFVAALIQSDEQGSDLAKALRGYSGELRLRRRQAAEEQANKISVQLVFPVFFFIFPALFVVLAAPAVIHLLRELLPLMGR